MAPPTIHSLVSRSDIAAHLRLYGAIRSHLFVLSERHVYFAGRVLCPTPEGKLFLRRSVFRFKLWIERVLQPKFKLDGNPKTGLMDFELPPFDVILILHGYMLHPRAFYEDTIRLYPELGVLNGFPLAQVASLINDSMQYIPTTDQIAFWESKTGELFALPLQTTDLDEFTISCPGCKYLFTAKWRASSSDGLGSDLAIVCGKCELLITDLVFGASIFLDDIRRARSSEGFGISGTLLTTEGIPDLDRSRALTLEIANAIGLEDTKNFDLNEAVQLLLSIPETTSSKFFNFLECYGLPGGFLIDIADAALRQTGFASKMYHAGWTNPRFPIERPSVLVESVKRYGNFLSLTMDPDVGSLGPAHDIDLIWHTHQLTPTYRDDFMRLFGWFLDHVDYASFDVLATSYSNGEDRWQKSLGTSYHDYFLSQGFPIAA